MSSTQAAGEPARTDADLELLSAWLDGELEAGQYNAMLERLKSEPALRAQFEWFNLAGDALRSHEVAASDHPALVAQVRLALQAEPVRIGPGAFSRPKLLRHVATGVTVAAAAGMLVVVALPQLRGPDTGSGGAPMAGPSRAPVTAVATAQPAVKVVAAGRTPQLEAYFRAHRELEVGVMPSAAAYIRMSAEPDR